MNKSKKNDIIRKNLTIGTLLTFIFIKKITFILTFINNNFFFATFTLIS